MKEIAPGIYIETGYHGVTLGAVNWPHGLLLIDSPSQPEDVRSWRAALLNLGGGIDRMLIYMDAHADRTLGGRGMECTLVASEATANAFRGRPANMKGYQINTGADWELFPRTGNLRWAPPEITFSEKLLVYWNTCPMILEHRPGPSKGAIWADFPDQKVIFIGDTVLANQPPFLSDADIPIWQEQLNQLNNKHYEDYLIVNGREGLISHNHVATQKQFLRKVSRGLERLAKRRAPAEKTENMINNLLKEFSFDDKFEAQYRQRLQHGLYQCYVNKYLPSDEDENSK